MAQMHLGDFRGPDGRILQRTEITLSQKAIFNALRVKEPPLVFAVEPSRKPHSDTPLFYRRFRPAPDKALCLLFIQALSNSG
jgi:hypothetical protein